MQRHGFATAIAADGSAAIQLLGGSDYACVILDLMMPEVGGRDVLSFLKETNRKAKVIVCTAALSMRHEEFDPELVHAVIRKPFDIEQLAEIVTQLTK